MVAYGFSRFTFTLEKIILRKPLFLAFHWRGSISFENDLIHFFANFPGRKEVFGSGFFQGNVILIGGTNFSFLRADTTL